MYSIVKICKKIIFVPFLFVTAFLSSCSEQEKVEEFRIKERCIGNVCSLTLVDLSINRSRNVIGKITDHTLSSDTVNPQPPTNIIWTIENGSLAKSDRMDQLGLDTCVESCSTKDANPTGAVFEEFGRQTVHVEGTVNDSDGNQRKFEITHHFTTVEHPIDLLQDLANNLTVKAHEHDVEAHLTQGVSQGSASSSLADIIAESKFLWAIYYSNSDNEISGVSYSNTQPLGGAGTLLSSTDVQFNDLTASTYYKVGLVIEYNGIPTEQVLSETVRTGDLTVDGFDEFLNITGGLNLIPRGNMIKATVGNNKLLALYHPKAKYHWNIKVSGNDEVVEIYEGGSNSFEFKELNYDTKYKVEVYLVDKSNGKEVTSSPLVGETKTQSVTDDISDGNNSLQLLANSITATAEGNVVTAVVDESQIQSVQR